MRFALKKLEINGDTYIRTDYSFDGFFVFKGRVDMRLGDRRYFQRIFFKSNCVSDGRPERGVARLVLVFVL